jgi:hypothetical protein
VTLQVEGISLTTQSDEQGQFLLQPAPVGHVKLIADGSTAPPRDGRPWPKLEYELVTIAGQNNTIGMPIYLLPIDEPNGLLVDETHGGTLTLPEVPGFALTIVPGSATFPDGSKRGTVSVTVVHADKVPMVPNFGQQPRFIITIQPAGTHFNPPAAMTLPNVDGLAPGQKTEMYSFDHDLGSFVSIGPATVSEDGTVVKSDPGVGVIKGGWHCGGNPSTTGSAGTCPECQKCQGNQCTPDNGRTCDDGKLCTSFSGTSIGPDQCAGGACKGSTIPDKDLVGITPLEFDLTALNQLIKGTAKAINLAPGCDVSDPSISGGIEISFFDRCCEPQGFLRGEKFSGFVTYNLAGVECIVPGLSVNLLNLVEVGIFVGIGASGTLSGGGDNGPCGHCNWSVGVNLGVTLSGGAKIITIQVPDFLDARLGIKGAGSINAESRCGNDSISGCAGPVTIFGEIVLAGFVKHNVDFTIPNSQICA